MVEHATKEEAIPSDAHGGELQTSGLRGIKDFKRKNPKMRRRRVKVYQRYSWD